MVFAALLDVAEADDNAARLNSRVKSSWVIAAGMPSARR